MNLYESLKSQSEQDRDRKIQERNLRTAQFLAKRLESKGVMKQLVNVDMKGRVN